MPRGDRTGPDGFGPMSGRGLGYCNGYNSPGFTKDYGRQGMGRGYGRGFSRGPGRGYGRGLGRGYGRGYDRSFYPAPPPEPIRYDQETEKKYIENELKSIEEEKKSLKERLEQLSEE